MEPTARLSELRRVGDGLNPSCAALERFMVTHGMPSAQGLARLNRIKYDLEVARQEIEDCCDEIENSINGYKLVVAEQPAN